MTEINIIGDMIANLNNPTYVDIVDVDKNEMWVILYQGRQLIFKNGKTIFRKKGHAKSSLYNNVFYGIKHDLRNKFSRVQTDKIYKETLQELEDNGIIEFKRLI